MKRAIACLLLLFFLMPLLHAQQKVFLRIYDTDGKKISKGYFSATTDSSIVLLNGKDYIEIPAVRIGDIKSQHIANRIFERSLEVAIITVAAALIIVYIALVISDRHSHFFHHYPFEHDAAHGSREGRISGRVRLLEKYKVNGDLSTWHMQRYLLDQFL